MFQFRKLAEKDFGHSVTVRSLILNVLIRKGVEVTVLFIGRKLKSKMDELDRYNTREVLQVLDYITHISEVVVHKDPK